MRMRGYITAITLLAMLTAASPVHTAPAEEPGGRADAPAAVKQPVPDVEARARARQKIESVFELDDLNTSAARKAAAARMLQVGKQTRSDAAEQFMLLSMARELAMQASDLEVAMATVDELGRTFQIDLPKLEARTLYAAVRWNLSDAQETALAERILRWTDEAVAANRLDLAEPLVESLFRKSRRLRDVDLRKRIVDARKRVEVLTQQWAKVKSAAARLQTAPHDADANLQYGRYLCFAVGDWARGLPHLAKGSDAALKELAQRDLAGPQKAEQQLELADDWYSLSESQEELRPCRQRAGHWYQRVHRQLDGLSQMTVAKRLQQLGVAPLPRDDTRDIDPRPPDEPAAAGKRSAQASLVAWTSGKPPARLLRDDQGFCLLGGVRGGFNGHGQAFGVALQRDAFWYLNGKSKEPLAATAMVVPTKYRQLFEDQVLTFTCSREEGPIKMIHSSDGFCFLSAVSGKMAGGGEEARVFVDRRDGFWYLRLRSEQPLAAKACALRFKKPGEFDAVVTEHSWKDGQEPVRLLQADEGFCFLSAVGGSFGGPQESVGIVLRDGAWHLGDTAREFLVAKAISVQVPKWHEYDLPLQGSR